MRSFPKHLALPLLCSALFFAGCGDDDTTPSLDGGSGDSGPDTDAGADTDAGTDTDAGVDAGPPPGCPPLDEYPTEGFETRAAAELEAVTRFAAINARMREAEMSLDVRPTAEELGALFDAGDPSTRELTSTYYAGLIDDWFDSFAEAAGQTYVPSEPPPANGGVWVSWIYDARGVDLRQAYEKGGFGASHYRTAAALLAADRSPEAIDRALALYGAHASFQHSDAADNPLRDRFTAVYAKRRDDRTSDTAGLYRLIQGHFLAARGAAEVGEACNAVRDAAATNILREWERILFATVIYYANAARDQLGGLAPTDMQLSAALHGIGEAVGFVHGFRTLDNPERIITDAQIDELLTLLNSEPGEPVNVYRFVTDPGGELPKLQTVIDRIAEIYGFTDSQVTSFYTNY
ncbi:MAG: DUF4856 domain-containing protein [Myxococcota bacterium]|jgi:hypothetical protein|nr:DUF4856 domain-containing protein [Myxococcota bacterium]